MGEFVTSIVICLIGFLLNYFFTKNPKLRWFYGAITEIPFPKINDLKNGSSVDSSEEVSQKFATSAARTHTVVITNQGNATAHNIRIGHYTLPPAYSVHPPMNLPVQEGSAVNEILIPTLSAKEMVSVSYLYFDPLHYARVNAYIKCDEGMAEIANLQHVNIRSPILKAVLQIILFVGFFSMVYWAIKLGVVLIKVYALVGDKI